MIATDLLSGRELRISRGDSCEAVLASAAIPGVFAPVDWEGRKLIDGGVSNNAPIADAIELGAERIYVLPTASACDLPDPPRGAVAMLLHAMSLLVMRRLLVEVEALSERAELIVLPPPCPQPITPIDFSYADELIRRGYEGSRDHLAALATGRARCRPRWSCTTIVRRRSSEPEVRIARPGSPTEHVDESDRWTIGPGHGLAPPRRADQLANGTTRARRLRRRVGGIGGCGSRDGSTRSDRTSGTRVSAKARRAHPRAARARGDVVLSAPPRHRC